MCVTRVYVQKACDLYRQGYSLKQLGIRYGISRQCLHRHLLKAGVRMRPAGRPSKADEDTQRRLATLRLDKTLEGRRAYYQAYLKEYYQRPGTREKRRQYQRGWSAAHERKMSPEQRERRQRRQREYDRLREPRNRQRNEYHRRYRASHPEFVKHQNCSTALWRLTGPEKNGDSQWREAAKSLLLSRQAARLIQQHEPESLLRLSELQRILQGL